MVWKSKADDGALIAKVAHGDAKAFTILYRRHQRAVYAFTLMLSGSEQIAADATQEAFIEFLKVTRRFDPEQGSLAAWLCGVARNCVHRHRRDFDAPIAAASQLEALESVAHESVEPLASLERARATEAVRRALARLEPAYREVLILCTLQDFSYAQAAAICGIDADLVRSRLSRGKRRLAELLKEPSPPQARRAA